MFTLRGQVIPVLNLGRIFDPAAPAAERSHKIAIVDHGEIEVGVIFHDTGEVLRVRPEQRSMLQYRDPASRNVVCGTIALDDGARLLEILDPGALAAIENVPHVQMLRSIGRSAGSRQFAQRAAPPVHQLPCGRYRVRLRDVRDPRNHHGPGADAKRDGKRAVSGPDQLPRARGGRGRFCLAAAFRRARRQQRARAAHPGGAGGRDADRFSGRLGRQHLPLRGRRGAADSAAVEGARDDVCLSCVSGDDGADILFLNHEGIFSQAELVEVGLSHVRLYQAEAEAAGGGQRARSARNRGVYVVFSLDSPWAVEIRQLREIIEWREGMVQPPGLPRCVRGILNLRHQMISVIDLRCLFGMGGRLPIRSRARS
ncbi:chemotaxis protein CheW [Massilia sp. B-10]|nr:chemotaxis protein CheW [Massilia sp. B-10]